MSKKSSSNEAETSSYWCTQLSELFIKTGAKSCKAALLHVLHGINKAAHWLPIWLAKLV